MIKNLLRAAVIGSLILGATTVMAKVQTFGPANQKFSVDVPDGWQAAARDVGVQLASPDGASSVDIQVQPNPNHLPLKQIVDAIAANLPKAEIEESEGVFVIKTEVDGTRVGMTVFGDDNNYAAITLSGNDADLLNKILDSISFE